MKIIKKKTNKILSVVIFISLSLLLFQNCTQFEAINHEAKILSSQMDTNQEELVIPEQPIEPEPIEPEPVQPMPINPPMEPEVTPPVKPPVVDPEPPKTENGKIPTKPQNLRYSLLSTSGLELDWEPSTDEGGKVVGYKIFRNNELLDEVLEKDIGKNDIRKRYFLTTSYYDCNHMDLKTCGTKAPKPGIEYNYEIQAIDNDGNVSEKSEKLTVKLHPITPNAIIYNIKNNEDYKITFNEEFNSVSLNALKDKWSFRRVWDKQGVYSSEPDVKQLYSNNKNHQQIINGEQGYMVDLEDVGQTAKANPYQSSQGGQALKIEAKPATEELFTTAFTKKWSNEQSRPVLDQVKKLDYSTGLLRTKMGFTNGYFEARMKLAGTHGMLSTFYLLHKTYSVPEGETYGVSEVDIMEYLGGSKALYGNPDRGRFVYQNYHYKSRLASYQPVHKTPGQVHKRKDEVHFSNDFHTYGVYWNEGIVIWYIDGIEINRMTGPAITTDPKELIISLVVGGEWAGPPDTGAVGALEIDYVKVYQKKDQNTVINPPVTNGTIKVSGARFVRYGNKNGELFWDNPENLKSVITRCEVDGNINEKTFANGEKSFYISDLGSEKDGFCELQATDKDGKSGEKLKVLIPAK